ncbi:MAG TPA: nucleotidyltransferase family protein [Saprospiraceae bacterium]|nr:nucleotidyltransferase family protein [Saprospiraceae bacterium]HMQ82318.1 nucleotidyltransferase family protein [Saprospiraceae bacterium]
MTYTAIIILAAGNSSRMGQLKQLLPYKGKTLLQHAVDTAIDSELGPVFVVLGHEAEHIGEQLKGEKGDFTILHHPGWAEGMGSSIRVGLKWVLALWPQCSQCLITLADQPLVNARHLQDLVTATEEDTSGAATVYDNQVGVPAFFKSTFFNKLLELQGDKGAKALIEAHRTQFSFVTLPDAAVDLDTPEDWTRWATD